MDSNGPTELGLHILHVVVDFDKTISQHDTTVCLVELGANKVTKENRDQYWQDWFAVADLYNTRFKEILQRHLKILPCSNASFDALEEYFQEDGNNEVTSIALVISRRFFAGVTKEELRSMGRTVQLQEGAVEVLRGLQERGATVNVISANWCGDILTAALDGIVPAQNILCNQLVFDAAGKSTGELQLSVVSAADKRAAMEKILLAQLPQRVSVYIGDSLRDLLALLRADIGIVINPAEEFHQMAAIFGIKLVSVGPESNRDVSLRSVLTTVTKRNDCKAPSNDLCLCQDANGHPPVAAPPKCIFVVSNWTQLGKWLGVLQA